MKTFILLLMLGFIFVWLIDYRIEKPQANQQEESKQTLLQEIENEKAKLASQLQSKSHSNAFPTSLDIDANIKSVYYGQTNLVDSELSFAEHDLCDTAVVIELMNGKFLSWQWVEEGNYGPEFSVSYSEQNPLWEDGLVSFREVSASQNWQPMITQRLLEAKTKTKSHPAGGIYISDLILHFSSSKIQIRGIEEPRLEDMNSLETLAYAPDWTAIIFDSALKKHQVYA